MAFFKLSKNPTVLEHITEIVEGGITEEKLIYHFNSYLFSKETKEINYSSEDLYVLRTDINRLIHLVANDIISFALNKIVDKGIMQLCWDNKAKDFIFLEKRK